MNVMIDCVGAVGPIPLLQTVTLANHLGSESVSAVNTVWQPFRRSAHRHRGSRCIAWEKFGCGRD